MARAALVHRHDGGRRFPWRHRHPLPFVEIGIALSVVVLGAIVAFGVKTPLAVAMGVVGLFAIFHGHAHGTEMPMDASGATYGAGFMLATALLHAVGIGIGMAGRLDEPDLRQHGLSRGGRRRLRRRLGPADWLRLSRVSARREPLIGVASAPIFFASPANKLVSCKATCLSLRAIIASHNFLRAHQRIMIALF